MLHTPIPHDSRLSLGAFALTVLAIALSGCATAPPQDTAPPVPPLAQRPEPLRGRRKRAPH
jgi:hypothetical protein